MKRPFSDAEREQLLRGCKTLRDKAMMEFLYSTAVRVSELARLNIEDIRWSTKDLIVYGKGRKERTVYINERTNMYLQEYLQSRTDSNPALFVGLRKPNDYTGNPFQINIQVDGSVFITNLHLNNARSYWGFNITYLV